MKKEEIQKMATIVLTEIKLCESCYNAGSKFCYDYAEKQHIDIKVNIYGDEDMIKKYLNQEAKKISKEMIDTLWQQSK